MRIVLTVFILVGQCAAAAAAASPQLYGKTVSVSWSADVVRREVGEQNFSHSGGTHLRHLIIYISTAGRPFLRRWNGSRSVPKASEQVGTSGSRAAGGVGTVEFKARSLIVTTVDIGGATHVQVDFDATFEGCTASAIVGKVAGANTIIRVRGDRRVEVQSASISGVTCSIEEGNAFAR